MISEIRIHPSHEVQPEQAPSAGRRELPLMCPHCQEPINLAIGLCGNRQIDAILLQSERIGTELECNRCGLRFVFHRTGSLSQLRQAAASREPVNPGLPHGFKQSSVKIGNGPGHAMAGLEDADDTLED